MADQYERDASEKSFVDSAKGVENRNAANSSAEHVTSHEDEHEAPIEGFPASKDFDRAEHFRENWLLSRLNLGHPPITGYSTVVKKEIESRYGDRGKQIFSLASAAETIIIRLFYFSRAILFGGFATSLVFFFRWRFDVFGFTIGLLLLICILKTLEYFADMMIRYVLTERYGKLQSLRKNVTKEINFAIQSIGQEPKDPSLWPEFSKRWVRVSLWRMELYTEMDRFYTACGWRIEKYAFFGSVAYGIVCATLTTYVLYLMTGWGGLSNLANFNRNFSETLYSTSNPFLIPSMIVLVWGIFVLLAAKNTHYWQRVTKKCDADDDMAARDADMDAMKLFSRTIRAIVSQYQQCLRRP